MDATDAITAVIVLLHKFIAFTFIPANARQTKKDIEHAQNTIMYLNLEWWENYKDDILTQHLKELYNKINCLISTITLYKATGGKNLYETAANI